MTQLLQALVNGVSLAAIYALIALGFVIIYKSMQVLNFAQPALLLLGGYWVLYFATIWDWPFGIALLVGAALAALTGVVVELRQMGDPWGLKFVQFAGLNIAHRQIAVIVTVVLLVSLLLAFFKFSRMGLAMRATA